MMKWLVGINVRGRPSGGDDVRYMVGRHSKEIYITKSRNTACSTGAWNIFYTTNWNRVTCNKCLERKEH